MIKTLKINIIYKPDSSTDFKHIVVIYKRQIIFWLTLRIEAILRRTSVKRTRDKTNFTIGRYSFDSMKQVLAGPNGSRKLTTKENGLLALLCKNANDILQRDYALSTIWVEEGQFKARSMDVYIAKLRSFLKDDPDVEIINIHGQGYKLVCPVNGEEE